MIRCLPINNRGDSYDRSRRSAKWQPGTYRTGAEGFHAAPDEIAKLPTIEFGVLRFVVQNEEEELVFHNVEVGTVAGIYRRETIQRFFASLDK